MNLFTNFPDRKRLLELYKLKDSQNLPEINAHIHSPYSFSAFSSIEQAFQKAKEQNIHVLGINDIFSVDGYTEFALFSLIYRIFPLFNIEFMALEKDLKKKDIRVNDPKNPGRIYFSGKGLHFPVKMNNSSKNKLLKIQQARNNQTYQMVERLNTFFKENNINIMFSAKKIHKQLAKGLLRERHIAQAIRLSVYKKVKTNRERRQLLEKIFLGKKLNSPINDDSLIENEIRNNLLKKGGNAYIPEDNRAFLPLKEVMKIIINAGGIPCYPMLLDNSNGEFTNFEKDKEKLLNELIKNNIYSIELIPGRNNFKILKEFVTFFHNNGFIITFGTEHNTSQLTPLKISCRNKAPLDKNLLTINHEGASVIAAHQYLTSRGEQGYLKHGIAKIDEKEKFIELGKAVIDYFINN